MHFTRPARSATGFSLIELMLVVGVMGIVMAIAVLQAGASRASLKSDGAMRVVLGQLRMARELAITQRRYMRITFTDPDVVTVDREAVPGTKTETETMSTTSLEGGVTFMVAEKLPDTPERFGNQQAIDFGDAKSIKFSPDGTLVNQDGASANGTVFLATSATDLSVRAITVMGATGRIRGYRWDGHVWVAVS